MRFAFYSKKGEFVGVSKILNLFNGKPVIPRKRKTFEFDPLPEHKMKKYGDGGSTAYSKLSA